MIGSRRWATTTAIIVVTVALDQLTKEWATNRLSRGRTIELLPTLDFRLAKNSGFSFSTGSGNGQLVGLLVIALCLFIVVQIRRETSAARTVLFATILGGALGNLADRVFRADDGWLSGEVIDFIDVNWYAVFNLADTFVVCGCIAFVIHELRHRHDHDAPSGDEAETAAGAVGSRSAADRAAEGET